MDIPAVDCPYVVRSIFVMQTDAPEPLSNRHWDTLMVYVPKTGAWSVRVHAITTEHHRYYIHLVYELHEHEISLVSSYGHRGSWDIEDVDTSAGRAWRITPTADILLTARMMSVPAANKERH